MDKEKKEKIESLKINSKDVGSSEVQIGLLSSKIDNLSTHFKKNKNAKPCILMGYCNMTYLYGENKSLRCFWTPHTRLWQL